MSDRKLLSVRVASGSSVKIDAVKAAMAHLAYHPQLQYEITGHPTELQNLTTVNAQPEGRAETEGYARARLVAMCRDHEQNPDGLDIAIESGAIDGADVAIVLVAFRGQTYVAASQPVPFPEGVLEAARERGFKTTTAGQIVYEWSGHTIPANDWHTMMVPGMTREKQIAQALMPLLRGLLE